MPNTKLTGVNEMKAANRMKPIAGSKRNGKSHKSWLGVFSPNTCLARLQANIATFGMITCENLCGNVFGEISTPKNNWQLDHFTPIAANDANGQLRDHSIMNTAILCKACNASKGKKLPTEFFTAETIARIEALQKLAASYTKDDFRELAKTLAMQSRKVAKRFDGGKYLRLYWQ
jgi:5-methylcytosine-specific restriction endonuclease McrA